MINKQDAIQMRDHALKAISELSSILNVVGSGKSSEEEYARVKKGVGISIGRIQTDILDLINSAYPELDDLK